ncbi:hypothetical protein CC1G_09505 [Coprinopsis cinerea okayama7|uniref:Nucleoporin Nup54 alpha-helical domain-containing protein n=1 Tax=Coprinopsis cinerea (strain Okayama-7 / 130 / ATCC MYA-4618 / FGSC 9003) TaxID=240176 RepID=A8P0S5_COPC7|nr:hypothetical protein CC1G_09505 [Coprinopsis cinerea okayama7\|eukprot:XP_001837954.1 hypothetical protein CC1G_09505 [Coprinopsis cinerea okayama7\
MSLFGGGSAFGSTNTGGGLFGQQQQQQQPQQQQPSLFGNTGGTGTTAPLQAQPTQPAFGASTTTGTSGGGLFGSTNASTNTGGGLFGNTGQQNTNTGTGTTGGLFGNTSTTGTGTGGGLFGNTNTNQQQGTTGGGLFGNTNTNQQQGTTGGGLFGNTNANQQQQQQPATGGGLFGSTTTQQPATGGGLFGNTQQQQQNTGGGLFGKPAGGGLFGSTSTTTNTGGGLFGNTQQQQQQQQQQQPQQQQGFGGLFGQSTNTGAGTGSLFGNKSTLGTSALGQPGATGTGTGGLLGTSTLGTSSLLPSRSGLGMGGSVLSPSNGTTMESKIEAIYNAWNPASPLCRFQHPFYNLVNPNEVGLYGRPPNVLNDAVWEKAVQGNPDPKCFVPVVAIGFDDLRERVDGQSKKATEQSQMLSDLKQRLAALSTKHDVSNVSRLQRASVQQAQITHRLLKLIQHLHLLIPAVRSSSIRPEEEQLRGKLEEVEDEGKNVGGGEWAVVDEEGMAQIVQVLKEQQIGLAHLTNILQKNQKDVAIVLGQSNSDDLQDGESLWSSTSTLRASALR